MEGLCKSGIKILSLGKFRHLDGINRFKLAWLKFKFYKKIKKRHKNFRPRKFRGFGLNILSRHGLKLHKNLSRT